MLKLTSRTSIILQVHIDFNFLRWRIVYAKPENPSPAFAARRRHSK